MASKRQPTLAESWGGQRDTVCDSHGGSAGNSKTSNPGLNARGLGRGRGGWKKNEGSAASSSRGQGSSRVKKRGRGRGRGRAGSIHVPDSSVICLEDDDDELCQQALGQFELAESDIAKALETGANAKEIPGFDGTAGETWIYPTNRPIRDYQFTITKTALFHNTLVSLPTGLGKTFIAAVVMYNYYRWFPNDIVVFMAPTRPLVAQQLDACHNIVGINPAVTVELTGQILPAKRELLWKEKQKVRCIVIDEAHKAVGNHSYAQVVSAIIQKNNHFRVLALSATPGNEVDAIQQVLKNLLISRVELRSDKSPDVLPYVHNREVETVVVSMDSFMLSVHEQIKDVFQVYTGKLMQQNILPRNGSSLGSYQLLQSRQRFRATPPLRINQYERGLVEVTFSTCISLARSIELLTVHGLRSFYAFLHALLLREKGSAVVASELRKKGVEEILRNVQEKLNISIENSSFNISSSGLFDSFNECDNIPLPQTVSDNIEDYLQSHPKMKVLKDIVEKHFETFTARNESTRVMIFSQYRDSVQEIGNLLNILKPRVKPMVFMGQAKTAGTGGRGLKQKEQIQVVEKFKEGGFNVLVATSVGEEGLDIGDVDLIICYDSNKSPTRNIQRMGRTGRQRQGRIVFLLTEGREERLYRFSLTQQSSIQKSIMDPGKLTPYLYPVSPRMVPEDVVPQCFKMSIILSSEHENYFNRRKANESKDEVTLDDSDFIRPVKPAKKKVQRGVSGKTKSGPKKSSINVKTPAPDVNTIARYIELMESKKSTSINPSLPTETIVIDDELPYCTPPLTDFEHSVAMVDDDYEIYCSLFDIREINAQSAAAPCVHVPLSTQELKWKPDYNRISKEYILLSDLHLQTVKELVDSNVYAGAIDRYCKCGNPGSADISLAESMYERIELDEEFNQSFSNPCQGLQPLAKPFVRKSLSQVQPVALHATPMRKCPTPSTETGLSKSDPHLNIGGFTLTSSLGNILEDESKYFGNDHCSKRNSIDKFDGAFIFDDDNDPMNGDGWIGNSDTVRESRSTVLQNVNTCTVNSASVNTEEEKAPNANTLAKTSVFIRKSQNQSMTNDDSSTASESEFTSSFIQRLNGSVRLSQSQNSFNILESSENQERENAAKLINVNFQQGNTSKPVAFYQNVHSNRFPEELKSDSRNLKLLKHQTGTNPGSPDLGLRRRKFTFKKKTSGGNKSFDLTPAFDDVSSIGKETSICEGSDVKWQDKTDVVNVSLSATYGYPDKPAKHVPGIIYNPREMFSRLLDDSEIDVIPGTSSDEDDPKGVGKLVEDNIKRDTASDSTNWDPDELPPTPPDASEKAQSKQELEMPCSSKRDSDFVFSPDRRNFPLVSRFSNSFSKKVSLRNHPEIGTPANCSVVPCCPKNRSNTSLHSMAKNSELEKPELPEVQYLSTTPRSVKDFNNSRDYLETPLSCKQETPAAKKFKFRSKINRVSGIYSSTDSLPLTKSPLRVSQSFLSATARDAGYRNAFSPARSAALTQVAPSHASFSDSSGTPKRPSAWHSPGPKISSPLPPSSAQVVSSPDSDNIIFRKRCAARRIIDSDERPAFKKPQARKIRKKKSRKNPFLLDEADGTSEDSSIEDFDESACADDSFIFYGENEDEDQVPATQQHAMYLQSVKDIIPVRTGRIEEPLLPDEQPYEDGMIEYLDDSFCDDDVEYADVGVYTQCMIAAREEIEKEKKTGKSARRLRSRR